VNINDASDSDNGPNELMNFPVISSTGYNSSTGTTYITGTLDTQNPQNATIEIFASAPDLFFNHGEGKSFLGSTNPDNSGAWAIVVPGIIATDVITATATNSNGNTSEFALNKEVVVGINEYDLLTSTLVISPNPAIETLSISYELTNPTSVELSLLNIFGENITTIFKGEQLKGKNEIKMNIEKLPSGFYFIMIETDHQFVTMKKLEVIN
jgi:hypothetical protein